MNKFFFFAVLVSIFLLPTTANAGGGDIDPNDDLALSGVIERDDPLAEWEESSMIRYFADRFFHQEEQPREEQTFRALLIGMNDEIKKSGSQIEVSCEALGSDRCVILGNTIELGKTYYPDNWSICTSNTPGSALDYILDVIKYSGLDDDEIQKLVNARFLQFMNCSAYSRKSSNPLNFNAINSPYYDYLVASSRLYKEDYYSAKIELKSALKRSETLNEESWLRQAIVYTRGRVSLLQSQNEWEGWSDWSGSEGLDEYEILNSITLFEEYIEQYPNGRWVSSALGLISRAHYFLRLLESDKEDYETQLHRRLNHEIINYSPSKSLPVLANVFHEFSKLTDLNHIEMLTMFEASLSEKSTHIGLIGIHTEIAIYLKQMQSDDLVNSEKLATLKARDIFTVLMAQKLQESGQAKKAIELLLSNSDAFEYPSDVNILIAKYLEKHNGIADVITFPSYVEGEYYKGRNVMQNLYLNNMCDYSSIEPILQKQFKHEGDYAFDAISKHKVLAALFGYYLHSDQLDKAVSVSEKFESPDDTFQIALSELDLAKPLSALNHLISAKWLAKDSRQGYCESLEGENGEKTEVNYAYHYLVSGLDKAKAEKDDDLTAQFLHVLTLCSRRGIHGYRCGYSENSESSKHWFRMLHKQYPNSIWADKTPYYYN